MADRKKKITLYFTPESNLTDEDIAAMDAIPGPRHRNAAFVDPEGKLEPCDFVAGPAVPACYDHLPRPPGVEQEEEEEAATGADLTATQLKEALAEAGVAFPANAKKADLVLLYDALPVK